MASRSLEDRVDEPTPTSSFILSSLAGAALEYFAPTSSIAYRIVRSLFFSALTPLFDKVLYPDVPLKRLYKRNAPADALGVFTGQSLLSYF